MSSELVFAEEVFVPNWWACIGCSHVWNAAAISPSLLLRRRGSQYSVRTLIEVGMRVTGLDNIILFLA